MIALKIIFICLCVMVAIVLLVLIVGFMVAALQELLKENKQ